MLGEATTPKQAMRAVLQVAGQDAHNIPPEVIVETLHAAEIPITEENISRAVCVAREMANASQEAKRDPQPIPDKKPSSAAPWGHSRDRTPDSAAGDKGTVKAEPSHTADNDIEDDGGDKLLLSLWANHERDTIILDGKKALVIHA